MINFLKEWWVILFIVVVVSMYAGISLKEKTCQHYRLGQIDAINGIVKYELVKQEDNSTRWQLKEQK